MGIYLTQPIMRMHVLVLCVFVAVFVTVNGQYAMVPNHSPPNRPPAPPPVSGQPNPTLYWIFKESWVDARTPSGPFETPDTELPGMSSNFGAVRLASPSSQAQCGGTGATCNMFLNTRDTVLLSGVTMGIAGVPSNPTLFYIKDTDMAVTASSFAEGSAPVTITVDSGLSPVEFQAGLRINMEDSSTMVTINVVDTIASGFVLNGVVLVSGGSFQTILSASTTANMPLVLLTGTNSTATFDIAGTSTWVGGGIDARATTTFFVNQDSTSGTSLGRIACIAGATINLDGAANSWDLTNSAVQRACDVNFLSQGWTSTIGSTFNGNANAFCETGSCTFTLTSSASVGPTGVFTGNARSGAGNAQYEYQFPAVVAPADPILFQGDINVVTGTDVSITSGPMRLLSLGDININPPTSLPVSSSLELTSDTGIFLIYEDKAQFNTPVITFAPGADLTIGGFLQLDVTNVADEINYGDTLTVLTHEIGRVSGEFLQVKIRGWDKERAGNVSFVDYQDDQIVFTFTEIYFPPQCDNPIVQATNPACRPPTAPPVNETGSIIEAGQVVKKNDGLSTGEILGIILAVILLILIIVALIVGFILLKKRNRLRDGVDKDGAELDEPDFDDPDDRF